MNATESANESRAPRARRRWVRFSLRTLLVVVTVFGVWLGIKVDQARRQKRAVETLRALGAEIWYEHQRKARRQKEAVAALKALGTRFCYAHQRDDAYPYGINPGHELVVPKWLDELAGYDFFRTVISVQVSSPVSDEDLSHLAGLPYIERLYVTGFGNNVSDWELDQLRRPDRVIAPGARGNNVSDAGLAHLRRPDRLITFGARDTLIGDGFVKRLHGATRLESLELPESRITDEGLLAIRKLTKLKRLSLWRTKITDAGIAALRSMTALESLELGGTEITDAGLIHLKNANHLRHLSLTQTSVTDAGLSHLHGLAELRSVALDDTAATPEGIAALQEATPTLRAVDSEGAGRLMQEEKMAEIIAKLRKLGPPRRAAQPPGSLPVEKKVDAAN
jgi:hypothetical protein